MTEGFKEELKFDQYCTEQKEKYWTQEIVLKKIKDIFPNEDSDTILQVLSSGRWQDPRTYLAILKICNGSIDEVRRLVEVANGDGRDVWYVEYDNYVRLEIADFHASAQEKIEAHRKDLEEYLAWIESDN